MFENCDEMEQKDIDEKSLEQLKNQYIKNKKRFESNMHTMNRDQVLLEHLLLSIEEAMFSSTKEPETLEEALENTKKRFLNDLECCDQRFGTFNDFILHMESNHQNEEEVYDYSPENAYYSQDEAKENQKQEKVVDINYSNIVSENNKSVKENKEKPYKCKLPDCKKAYTSAYGLRYHMENGHVVKDDSDKPYGCLFKNCNKRYKNSNGLKYHVEHNHKTSTEP